MSEANTFFIFLHNSGLTAGGMMAVKTIGSVRFESQFSH